VCGVNKQSFIKKVKKYKHGKSKNKVKLQVQHFNWMSLKTQWLTSSHISPYSSDRPKQLFKLLLWKWDTVRVTLDLEQTQSDTQLTRAMGTKGNGTRIEEQEERNRKRTTLGLTHLVALNC
jgi:hypothetical protein